MTFHLWSQHVFHYSHYHINLDDVDWSRNSHHITHHHYYPHSSYANQQHTKNHNIFHHNDCVSSLQFLVSISFHYTVVIIYLTKRPLCRSYTDYYRMKNAINADITIPFIYLVCFLCCCCCCCPNQMCLCRCKCDSIFFCRVSVEPCPHTYYYYQIPAVYFQCFFFALEFFLVGCNRNNGMCTTDTKSEQTKKVKGIKLFSFMYYY